MSLQKYIALFACVPLLVASRALAEDHTEAGDDHDDHAGHDHDHDHAHDHADHGDEMSDLKHGEIPPCATDPASPDCVSYIYPDTLATKDAKLNCQMMEFMVACDVVEACEDGTLSADNPHCDPFDLLASTCKDEGMQGMAGCKVYTPMCLNASTVVADCAAHPGIPEMVNSNPTVVRFPADQCLQDDVYSTATRLSISRRDCRWYTSPQYWRAWPAP